MSKESVLIGIEELTKVQAFEISFCSSPNSDASVTVQKSADGIGYTGLLIELFILWINLSIADQQWVTDKAKLKDISATSRPDCPPCP